MRKVTVSKPEVKPNESEDDYVSRCILWVINNEGLDSKQAAGKCHGMFRSKKLKKRIDIEGNPSVNDIIRAIDNCIDPMNTHSSRRYVCELYPIKYPSGNVVFSDCSGSIEKFYQYSYTYEEGIVFLSSNFIELKDIFSTGNKTKEHKKYQLGLDNRITSINKKEIDKTIEFEQTQTKYETGIYIAPDDFDMDGVEIKKGQELHYVLGVVLEPETVDATRTNETIGDIYNEDEVRKAAHYFLANYKGKGNDFMHDGSDSKDLKIVESFIAPMDMELNGQKVKKGSWLMGTLVLNDEIWSKVKKGEITGYSIGGTSNAKVEVTETV